MNSYGAGGSSLASSWELPDAIGIGTLNNEKWGRFLIKWGRALAACGTPLGFTDSIEFHNAVNIEGVDYPVVFSRGGNCQQRASLMSQLLNLLASA